MILEPAIDPNNRISFLLDWELTMKCNLDCSYCKSGMYGGHDNTTKHPDYQDCIKAVDFMFKYTDLYMVQKPKGIRYVILNVYGGESLHHPRIVDILKYVKQAYESHRDRWHLTITTTTNTIVTAKKLKNIIPLVDEFTCSYHCEFTEKQQLQFKENLLAIKNSNRRLKCVVMMHNKPELFKFAEEFINWCKTHDIKYIPKSFDNISELGRWKYQDAQVIWFNDFYQKKQRNNKLTSIIKNDKEISRQGRACCGGRQLCTDQQYRQPVSFLANQFTDWYCSVDEFFLYVKQLTGEIYVNKDCKMNFDGTISPIGNLTDTESLLEFTRQRLSNNNKPTIQCKKSRCLCGLCAPKASDLNTFNSIMEKYHI